MIPHRHIRLSCRPLHHRLLCVASVLAILVEGEDDGAISLSFRRPVWSQFVENRRHLPESRGCISIISSFEFEDLRSISIVNRRQTKLLARFSPARASLMALYIVDYVQAFVVARWFRRWISKSERRSPPFASPSDQWPGSLLALLTHALPRAPAAAMTSRC